MKIMWDENQVKRYYDNNGEEIHAGNYVVFGSAEEAEAHNIERKPEKVYLCADEETLGTDATNPKWIENGRACPCEYGIYPFNEADEVYLVEVKE